MEVRRGAGMRLACVLLVLCILLYGSAVPAAAAKKTLKNQSWTQNLEKAAKAAKTVKAGSMTIKLPSKGRGFLKFRVPETRTWSFTISGLKAKKKKKRTNGYMYVMKPYENNNLKIGQVYLETQGGKSNTLWLGSKKLVVGTKKTNWELRKRIGKTVEELKAGEVVYLYFNFNPGDTLKLQIS